MKKYETKIPIIYVAPIGEEGLGDLRGVKHLLTADEHLKIRPLNSFLSIDSTESSRIVSKAIGSRRNRIRMQESGGSLLQGIWKCKSNFLHVSFDQQSQLILLFLTDNSTYSVGMMKGGTSVNTIPDIVEAELDFRSENNIILMDFDKRLRDACVDAREVEIARGKGIISVAIELTGNRPTGSTDKENHLISLIRMVNNHLNVPTHYAASSTDSNVPISLGIPALTLAGIEKAGRAHSNDESIDTSLTSLLPIKRNPFFIAILTEISPLKLSDQRIAMTASISTLAPIASLEI